MFDDLDDKKEDLNNQPNQAPSTPQVPGGGFAAASVPPQNSTPTPAASEVPSPQIAEDIFAETDKPAAFQPKQPGEGNPVAGNNTGGGKKVGIIIVAIIAVVVVGVGAFLGYNFFLSASDDSVDTNTPAVAEKQKEKVEPVKKDDTKVVPEEKPVVQKPVDTDGDGLSDEQEVVIGLDINNPDTDGDGLFDFQEISVYKTNPLEADSDGDGYSDGDEVKGGYNPNGEGKLTK